MDASREFHDVVQKYFDSKSKNGPNDAQEKCEMAMEATLIQSWTKVTKLIAIGTKKEWSGFFVFKGNRLANNTYCNLETIEVIPMDNSFKCELGNDKTRKVHGTVVPMKVTGLAVSLDVESDMHRGGRESRQLSLEWSVSSDALTLHNHVKRVLDRMDRHDQLFANFHWLDKYEEEADRLARVENRLTASGASRKLHSGDTEDPSDRGSSSSRHRSSSSSQFYSGRLGRSHSRGVGVVTGPNSGNNPSVMENNQTTQWLTKQLDSPGPTTEAGQMPTDNQYYVRQKLNERENEYCKWESHTIFVGSWNVNGRLDDSISLHSWLRVADEPPDFYVLGFQELDLSLGGMAMNKTTSSQAEERWLSLIEKSPEFQETSYHRLLRARLAGIFLVVYVKQALVRLVNKAEVLAQTVPTGMFNVMGNKGGVGIRVKMYHASLCFICCHLAAGEANLERRNQDYREVIKKMVFEGSDGNPFYFLNHDLIFFFGDLNYRIAQLECSVVHEYIKSSKYGHLLGFDELMKQRLLKRVFDDFQEGDIDFAPTYKFDPFTDDYNVSEGRTPSYCDRILWRGEHCEQLYYRSHMELKVSDHKPISSFFNVGLKRVDQTSLLKTYEAIIRSMDLLYNMYLPQASVDTHDIDFGRVKFFEPQQGVITITNTGQSGFFFDFRIDDVTGKKFPKWLTVNPESKFVDKDQSVTLALEAYINSDTVAEFNSGQLSLSEILVLTLQGGKHIFLSTNGTFVPTCFGLPLSLLLTLPQPVRKIPVDQLKSLTAEARTKELKNGEESVVKNHLFPFTSPRELFRLIDYITTQAIDEPELFLQPGLHGEIQSIRESLDCDDFDEPLPKVSVHSIVETLLIFLNSLPDAVVPEQFSDICLDAVPKGFTNIIKVLIRLPVDHRNIFHYIISFLKRCLDHSKKNGTTPELLASIFCEIIFRDCPKGHTKRDLKKEFVCSFLINDVGSRFAQQKSHSTPALSSLATKSK